ncbi:MAG: solute carrier family 26 protein [Chloroflexota bacterium]
MALSSAQPLSSATKHSTVNGVKKYLPFLDWLVNYRREEFSGDLLAGIIVAIMLVPQGMAYALLAGLPPQVGLYASILPLFVYGLLGSSRTLAVGPVAIVSLMVVAGVAPLAGGDVTLYIQLALTLALLVGILQLSMGFLRVGFMVNFLSHPVLVGFTAAAAIVIGFSQLKHVLGFSVPRGEFVGTVQHTVTHLGQTNYITLGIGVGSILILLFFKNQLPVILKQLSLPEGLIMPISKSAPLVVVLFGTLLVQGFGLSDSAGVKIVGDVPLGLPPLSMPSLDFNLWSALLPTALAISFIGYMESFSVAKSLASKRRQKVDADQELIGLGAANLAATFTGGYPVTGGFSRSVVNFAAGANTGLASMITAALIALTVVFLTPLFFYLPQAVLASIILVAVVNLIDIKTAKHIWAYNKADAAALIITFIAVLAIGVESGILVGAGASLLLFIWRTSRPHTAVVGRVGKSELYRNELRYHVQTWPEVLAIRVDQSLYFANTKYLEDTVLAMIADHPEVKHMILIGTAINFIDASALETLASLRAELMGSGVELHLAAIKGPVLDELKKIGFVEELGEDHIHFSTHDAMIALGYVDADDHCPQSLSPGAAAKAAQKRYLNHSPV